MKKIIKYLLLIIGFVILVYFVFSWSVGGIDIRKTLTTKYVEVKNSNMQIVSTSFFDIETPNNWIHISNGYGIEGNPYGFFMTSNEFVYYEVGLLSASFKLDSVYVFDEKIDTINNIVIYTAINENADEYGLSFYGINDGQKVVFPMSKSVKEHYPKIKEGFAKFKFNFTD